MNCFARVRRTILHRGCLFALALLSPLSWAAPRGVAEPPPVQGLIVQNPVRMSYLAVKTMVEHLQGKPVEKRIDTGVYVVTPENMDTPEMKELLYPPLEKYLK